MSKSKRLMELMMTVNRMRKFTVKELAREFGVSPRTILRDLQELSELGVPLYSEVGPHGGYQVLKERVLPPIAFTEEEAVALFFASHALRHYRYLPFRSESASALSKFYHYMPGDVRDRIDEMKNRVDFRTPARQAEFPFLSELLDAAVRQRVLRIDYASREGESCRDIQPVGIYASHGLWYCPAYCFLRREIRLFRCDRIKGAREADAAMKPVDLNGIHLDNWESLDPAEREWVHLVAELGPEAIPRCEDELGRRMTIHVREDGSGWLNADIPRSELPYFARFFIGLGADASVGSPPELTDLIRRMLRELLERYEGKSN
ncbi:helix-turn-helix transcriptional regulator [Cohnella zeiphila]|uniref:YafY family transcriptional regulator n=1 Tax=Cohnella zeiphila TaxID=2761120 RepID=A0A7X0SV32_9BACL|nr:YafY family protein [Cohnella zeiphila]MBB6735689.1 YafY family transcriptional regulator [Cohnella zeiphila]